MVSKQYKEFGKQAYKNQIQKRDRVLDNIAEPIIQEIIKEVSNGQAIPWLLTILISLKGKV